MHIALIISSLTAGGAERVLSELANAWVLRGHKISLFTFCAPGASAFYFLDDRIQIHQLNQLVSEECSFLRRLKNILTRLCKLRGVLKVAKPDVIISFVDVMNITTLLASIRLGVPIIVCERTHPYYHQLPRFYKTLRRLVYPWAAKVVSQTASASHYFATLPEEKKVIIPNQVTKPSQLKEERDILKPVIQIVSVGRLYVDKDFATLILAFSRIGDQDPDLKLTIYGEGSERQNLEKLIQELNLTTQISLPGTVKDVETALYQADLFVFPSRYEGFPNALCEAMAIGLPVIASDCSGNVDIIQEGIDGRLFPTGDVTWLAQLLQELIQDSSQRLNLSKGALTLPDRFSEKSVLQKWDEVLAEVMRLPKP